MSQSANPNPESLPTTRSPLQRNLLALVLQRCLLWIETRQRRKAFRRMWERRTMLDKRNWQ